jgi:hypothetical protein
MKLNSYLPALIRTSLCVAAALTAPVSFGAAAERHQAQAQLLDHAELLCDNCIFGPSYYYYCFAADNKILVGYQRTPVLNWEDKSKNYLTKVHHGWDVWTAPGETVPLSYDDKHMWVTRPNGKPVKLIQSYSHDIFLNNDRCRDAVKAKAK